MSYSLPPRSPDNIERFNSDSLLLFIALNFFIPTLVLLLNTLVIVIIVAGGLHRQESKFCILLNLAISDALTSIPYYFYYLEWYVTGLDLYKLHDKKRYGGGKLTSSSNHLHSIDMPATGSLNSNRTTFLNLNQTSFESILQQALHSSDGEYLFPDNSIQSFANMTSYPTVFETYLGNLTTVKNILHFPPEHFAKGNLNFLFWAYKNEDFLCRLIHLFWLNLHQVSVFSVCLLNFDMFLALMYPLKHICTQSAYKCKLTMLICGLIWFGSTGLIAAGGYYSLDKNYWLKHTDMQDGGLAQFRHRRVNGSGHAYGRQDSFLKTVTWQWLSLDHCFLNFTFFRPTFWYLNFGIDYALPLMWIIYSYLRIYRTLKKNRERLNGDNAKRRSSCTSSENATTGLEITPLREESFMSCNKDRSFVVDCTPPRMARHCRKNGHKDWFPSQKPQNKKTGKMDVKFYSPPILMKNITEIRVGNEDGSSELIHSTKSPRHAQSISTLPSEQVAKENGQTDNPVNGHNSNELVNDVRLQYHNSGSCQKAAEISCKELKGLLKQFPPAVQKDLAKILETSRRTKNKVVGLKLSQKFSISLDPSLANLYRKSLSRTNLKDSCEDKTSREPAKAVKVVNQNSEDNCGDRQQSLRHGSITSQVSLTPSSKLVAYQTSDDDTKKYIQISLLIIILFIICWTPFYIRIGFNLFTPKFRYLPPYNKITLALITLLLAELNSLFNPVFYCLRTQKFHDLIKAKARGLCHYVFHCKRCKRNLELSN